MMISRIQSVRIWYEYGWNETVEVGIVHLAIPS